MSAVLLCLLAAGCATVQLDQPGSTTLRHHNWWNYYERGVVFLARNDFAAAAQDFEAALGTRPGARFGFAEEMWRARTYGLHFVEGYFPHRELGVCLYNLGRNDEAIHWLETSMNQVPSGRAKHYLNLARGRRLKTARPAPPQILVPDLQPLHFTRDRTLHATGMARGEGLVASVTINGQPEFVELADREIAFQRDVPLTEGSNRVVFAATDLAGGRARREIIVYADWKPPALVIRKAERKGDGWALTCLCADDYAVQSLKVNGEERLDTAKKTRPRWFSFPIVTDGRRPVVVAATDPAGNRLDVVYQDRDLDGLARARYEGVYFAALVPSAATDAGTVPALDAAAASAAAAPAEPRKPSLNLFTELTENWVLREEFYLDGVTTDRGGIGALSINGASLLQPVQKGALQVRFAGRLPLALGTNRFALTSSGLSGLRNEKQFTLIRKNPDYLDREYRLRVEIPPPLHCQPAALQQTLRRQLQEEVTRDPVRFHLMERDEEGLAAILTELEISGSELADSKAALQIGKLQSVELVLFCSLLRNGNGLTLYARLVNAETGEIVWTGDVYAESEKELVENRINGLVLKTEQQFPLVEARIVNLDGRTATLSTGSLTGARSGARLLVVRRTANASEAGTILKSDGNPIELEITQTTERSAVGRIQPSRATEKVREGDYVYAR